MSRLVFFSADDGVHGRELWVTDGTPAGTRMVRDLAPGPQGGMPGYFSSDLTSLGDGRVIFEAGNAVWASDGTESGTIRMGAFPEDPGRFTLITPGEVVFRGRDERGSELWISDGTPGGTELLKEFQEGLHPDGWALGGFPTGLTPARPGRVVFAADDGVHGTELWVTDGTEAGTQMIGDLRPGEESGNPRFLTQIRPGLVLFEANSTLNGGELWATDGTAGGTRMIADLTDGPPGSILGPFTVLPGGRAAFTNLSGPSWITDGTAAGTYRLGSLPNMPEAPTIPEAQPLSVGELGIFREDSAVTLGQLGDGRLLFSDTTREGTEWYQVDPCIYWFPPECQPGYTGAGSCENPSPCPWPLRDELASRPLGRELWVTDGSQGGTRPVADLWPGVNSGDPSGFLLIPNGRALFTAREDDGSFLGTRALWSSDGSEEGTVKLISGIGTPRWPMQGTATGTGPDGRQLVVIEGGDKTGVWTTDGTEAGTELLFPNASEVRLSMSPFGDWLALPGGAFLTSTSLFGGGFRTWVTDGTAAGTRAVSDTLATWHMSDPVSMGDNRIVFTRNDPDIGREPWVFDTNSGAVVQLGDIMPGTEGSEPKDFVLAMPMTSQVPASTLFDALVSTQDEEQALPIGGFFTDPSGSALDFTVVGLPDGVTFDPATRQIDGTPADTGIFPVSVIVTNDLGGAVEAVFDWSVIDTGLLTLVSSTGWAQADPDGPINAKPGAILMIGRKDGDAPLIRIEGAEASIEDGKLTVSGKLFAEQYATTLPLMQGGFTIDMATLTVSDFEDATIDASHRLVGDLIEMAFTDIALRPDELVLRTDLSFGDAFTVFSTQGGLLALHLSDDGPSFGFSEVGTGRWFTDKPLALPLPEGAPFAVEFSDLGMNYDLLTDSVYLMGKAELTWGETVAKEYSFLADSTTSKLTFDLAGEQADDDLFAKGDKFLRIGKDAQGWNWDIVGEISYEGQEGGTPARGRPFIEEMTFSLDTVEKEFGGGFKGTLPFLFKGLTLEAEIGATWDPVAIDSFAFGIDGLNKPLGATGLFVQGGKLAAENLTAQDPEEWPEVSAQITMTVGPNTEVFVSPIRGFVGGKIKAAQVTLDFEAESKVEYLLPGEIERIAAPLIRWLGVDADDVLAFELMKLTGAVSVDFARPGFSAGLGAGFLGDMITGQAQFSSQTLGDVTYLNASVSATATFPEALPLIGGMSRAGNGLAKFSSDGDNSNDFAAAWINFTLPFIGNSSAGVRLWLDGRYEVLGRKDIAKIGSWQLGPEQEVVILSAQWETASDAARLELIAPDGTVLTEADFAGAAAFAAGIALVDDLNGPLGRHVALQNPVAGVWDIRLADATGLGEIRTEASEMLTSPTATISAVSPRGGGRAGTIEIDLDPGDAGEIALTLFVSDTPDALSGFDVIAATVPANEAGALSFDWDFAALASGSWWLHARAEGDGLVPATSMWATPIEVTGEADLAVTLEQQPAAGGASVLVATVANLGNSHTGAVRLDLSVPEPALNGPVLPVTIIGQPAAPLIETQTTVALPALAPGESLQHAFSLPAGLGPMTLPAVAEVSNEFYDADMTNNTDALFLATLSAERAGAITTRGGAALAGVEVEAMMADGSAVTAFSMADGGFSLAGLAPGAGMVTASYEFEPGQARITAGDALEVLRIAVGLQPAFGPAGPLDYIAADVNRDGQVTASDALDILRVAVGLPTPNAPQWVFLDAAADLSGITAGNVAYLPGIDLTTHPADMPLDMTAILLGNMTDPM